jgi:hypothetical protein
MILSGPLPAEVVCKCAAQDLLEVGRAQFTCGDGKSTLKGERATA